MITGRCLCGAVRYEISGTPLVMYHCHCSECRRASGSSFTTNVLVPTASFALVAGEDALGAFESSPGKRRHFCSRCGSPIFSASDATPQLRSVRCGTFEGDPGVRPSIHLFVSDRSPWFEIHDDLPQKRRGLADP